MDLPSIPPGGVTEARKASRADSWPVRAINNTPRGFNSGVEQNEGGGELKNVRLAREMGLLKVPDNISLDPVHVGDKVTYGVTEQGGVKSVTKIEKAKP